MWPDGRAAGRPDAVLGVAEHGVDEPSDDGDVGVRCQGGLDVPVDAYRVTGLVGGRAPTDDLAWAVWIADDLVVGGGRTAGALELVEDFVGTPVAEAHDGDVARLGEPPDGVGVVDPRASGVETVGRFHRSGVPAGTRRPQRVCRCRDRGGRGSNRLDALAAAR